MEHHPRTTAFYWNTGLLFMLHVTNSIATKRSSHLRHLPGTGSYPLAPAQKQGVIILHGSKKLLSPLQYTCSSQPNRRKRRKSTQSQQQTGLTLSSHHRQKNTAPQDQTRHSPTAPYRHEPT